MHQVTAHIEMAQQRFAALLRRALERGPITPAQYARYLAMQYHLTNGVQRYFITAAAHRDLATRKGLRQFLLDFANEEERHYLVAGHDLHQLGAELLPEPFDVTLWHSYFTSVVVTRPFVRLGAACILENISAGVARPLTKQALAAPFLTKANSKFLVLHQHESLPHGDQIVEALATASLEGEHIRDLVEGAKKGTVFYLRMAEWALFDDCLAAVADADFGAAMVSATEQAAIVSFRMDDLAS